MTEMTLQIWPPSAETFLKGTLVRHSGLNMAKFLSHDEINEFKECFSLYDKKRRGQIYASDLLTVMRCLGCCPTLSEVDRHLLTHNIDKSGELDFSSFLSMMHEQIHRENPRAEILQAMRMMDPKNRGFIPVSELRAKLTGFGERLTDQEVDELLNEAGVKSDGHVDYEEFVKTVAEQIRPPELPS